MKPTTTEIVIITLFLPISSVLYRKLRSRFPQFTKIVKWGAFTKLIFICCFTFQPAWKAMRASPAQAFEEPGRIRLYDRFDRLYTEWPDKGFRGRLKPDEVPDHLLHALIAREDRRFSKHRGIDYRGFARATFTNIRSGGIAEGGSTLTMQLSQHVYGHPEKTTLQKLQAKVFEYLMARKIENWAREEYGTSKKAKKAIATAYLDHVSYGYRLTGAREAAWCYFGKKLNQLSLGESAYLAGLLRATTTNNALVNPNKAREARDKVVAAMVREGFITQEEAARALFYVHSTPFKLPRRGDGFTSQSVRNAIDDLISEGRISASALRGRDIAIYLTHDFRIHDHAARYLRNQLLRIERHPQFKPQDKGTLNGAVVVIDNSTGQVLTAIGGRSYELTPFDIALQGSRQWGSCTKALNYAYNFDATGKGSHSLFSNAPLSRREVYPMKGNIRPRTHLAVGRYPAWKLYALSDNASAMRTAAEGRNQGWPTLLHSMGIAKDFELKNNVSAWLGTYAISPLRAAASYSVFPRGGDFIEPTIIRSIKVDGHTVYESKTIKNTVLSSRACREVTACGVEVIKQGTASRYGGSSFGRSLSVAGKTGTSGGNCDLWFVGYSSSVTCAVWIGFPDGNHQVLPWAEGGQYAYPVWQAIMQHLPHNYPFRHLPTINSRRIANSR